MTTSSDEVLVGRLLRSYTDAWGWSAGLPLAYLCVDIETSTFAGRPNAVIVEAGHCIVGDGKVVDYGSWILDWTRHSSINPTSLAKTLEHTKYHMETDKGGLPTGKKYKFNIDLLKTGVDPIKLLETYYQLFSNALEQGCYVIGHGVWFDLGFFNTSFTKYLGKPALNFDSAVFDTGIVAKALIAGLHPKDNEKVPDYVKRVKNHSNTGCKWNLKDMVERFTPNIEKRGELLHQAGYDAMLCHYVIEQLRSQYMKSAYFTSNELPSIMDDVTMPVTPVLPQPEVSKSTPSRRPVHVRRVMRRGS